MNESCPRSIFSERMLVRESERMVSAEEKLFVDERHVIITSTSEIDMTQWRKHLVKNWDKVSFLSDLLHAFYCEGDAKEHKAVGTDWCSWQSRWEAWR